jgi:hypothetical protein
MASAKHLESLAALKSKKAQFKQISEHPVWV